MAEPGVVQMFRLLFDKATADATEKAAQDALSRATEPTHAKENLSQVKVLMAELEHAAVHLGEAMLAAFAFHKIIGFFEESIKAAGENEHSMHQLETAVTNAGGAFDKMGPQIEANLNALYQHSRFTRVELREAMGSLIQLTGSVDKAMAAMSTTVEFATGRHLDLGNAATLVGRYLTGNVNALTRYIGKTAEGVNVMDRLAATFKNAAENEMKSYEGRLLSITKAKQDLLVSIGELIIGDTALGGKITNVSDILKAATTWVKSHHEELSRAVSVVIEFGGKAFWLAGVIGGFLMDAFRGAQVIIVDVAAKIEYAGQKFKIMGNDVMEATGRIAQGLRALDNFFGVHTSDAIGAWGDKIVAEAKKGSAAARAEMEVIKNAAKETIDAILNPPETRGGLIHKDLSPTNTGPLPTPAQSAADLEKEFQRMMSVHRAAAEMADENIKLGNDVDQNMAVLREQLKFFTDIANDSTQSIKHRNEALKEQAKIEKEIDAAYKQRPYTKPSKEISHAKGEDMLEFGGGADDTMGRTQQQIADIQVYGKTIGILLDGIDKDATKVATNIYDVFEKNLSHLTLSFKGLGQAITGIFKGTAKAILTELQEEAKGEAIHDAAAAIQQFAWGLARSAVGDAAGATLHYAAAKTFALSAVEWGGAAIAEGALLGSGSGGGGSAGSLTSGAGTGSNSNAPAPGPQVNIYIDGVDPLNPRHQELIGEAVKRFAETGGGKVTYNPGRRSA